MTCNERFNHCLNSCKRPKAVYAALLSLGRAGILGRSGKGAAGNA